MKDDPGRAPLSSSGWTGVTDETPGGPPAGLPRPPVEAARREEGVMALFLALLMFVLHLAWVAQVSLHSPLAPDPATGHVERLSTGRSAPTVCVRRPEVLVAHALLLGVVVLPGTYLAGIGLRRWWRRGRAR